MTIDIGNYKQVIRTRQDADNLFQTILKSQRIPIWEVVKLNFLGVDKIGATAMNQFLYCWLSEGYEIEFEAGSKVQYEMFQLELNTLKGNKDEKVFYSY